MKLAYIANIRIPTQKAHGVQISKTVEALNNCAVDVTLVIPNRKNTITDNIFSYYLIKNKFKIDRIFTIDVVSFGFMGFVVESLVFTISAYLWIKKNIPNVIYSRDELVAFFLCRTNVPLIWEAHTGKWNFFVRSLVKRAKKIIVISQGLKNYYIDKGVDSDKVFIVPDAADLNDFGLQQHPVDCPHDRVLYSGSLSQSKGVDLLIEAIKKARTAITFVIVGGNKEEIEKYKNKLPNISNVKFLGQLAYNKIPAVVAAADIVVLPSSAQSEVSKSFTSPMKLFEYLASGKPIIASDVPSNREVLGESDACWFRADNPGSLADAVSALINNPAEMARLSERSREISKKYSWEKRAHDILEIVNKI